MENSYLTRGLNNPFNWIKARQFVWHWLSEHFCPSRRVFLVMVQPRTEKPEERQSKWPWLELYAIAATFTASHIFAKGVQNVVLSGHLNQLNRLSSPALPHEPSLVQPNLDFIPLFLSPSVNNAFVVTPFPHTHLSWPIFNMHRPTGQRSNLRLDCCTWVIGPENPFTGQRIGHFSEQLPHLWETGCAF